MEEEIENEITEDDLPTGNLNISKVSVSFQFFNRETRINCQIALRCILFISCN